jgi:hypothetical protein
MALLETPSSYEYMVDQNVLSALMESQNIHQTKFGSECLKLHNPKQIVINHRTDVGVGWPYSNEEYPDEELCCPLKLHHGGQLVNHRRLEQCYCSLARVQCPSGKKICPL